MIAERLEDLRELEEARPGIYVVQSGTTAYFPAMARIESGAAKFIGELYEDTTRVVAFQIGKAHKNPEPTKRSITIGHEFFVTALKDYDDWQLKWWREAIQNSVDAGARNIDLGVQPQNGAHLVWADDDGSGMDEDTLINKFLVLGGTTKILGGTAGGFGKAKELLLLPWISWKIHSRDTIIEGAGIEYTVEKAPHRQGTRLEVVMPEDKKTTASHAMAFIEKSFLPRIRFTVNNNVIEANLKGNDLVSSVPDKADIYFSKSENKQPYLYVRTNGLFMFQKYVGEIPGYVMVELIAPSVQILAANRDGFRDYTVAREVDRLAERIAKDTLSAFRAKQGIVRKKYKGTGKFKAAANLLEQIGPTSNKKLSESDMQQIVEALKYQESIERPTDIQAPPPTSAVMAMLDQSFTGPNHIEAAIKQLAWEPDFYLMNEIENWKVPKKFFPETMTPMVLKLTKSWTELCRYVLMQLGSDAKFGVGLIFSESIAAAAVTERGDENEEHWLMLNPFKGMTEGDIWSPSQNADLKWLYAAAIHEATHVADKISYHDESFASALTRNMARCADGYRKIKQIVSDIRARGSLKADD